MVSVIVPTYQHGAFIAQCLDSILEQRTDFPVEILVGEDESTDGTREVCQRYAAEQPDRIRLFLRSRKDVMYVFGKPTGRTNLMGLIKEARGCYIAICEGDDYWTDPLKLQRQVDLLETDASCTGSFHATEMVDEHGVRTGALMRATLPGRMDADQTIGTLSPFHFSSFLFRASTCKTTVLAMPLRKTVSLDTGMFAVVADKGYLLNAGGVMSAYRKHDGGITNTATHKGMRFHQNRILLWLFMDRHMGYRHSSRCQEVMADHWKHVRWETTRRQRLSLVLEQIRSVPGWFLRHPKVAVQRIMDVVKR